MMKNLKLKRNILLITSSFIIISTACHEHKYTPEYEIIKETDLEIKPFAKYEHGYIYIGNIEYINKVKNNCTKDDILILDERDTDDPNILIYDSYKISNIEIRNTILEVIREYERMYPTIWDRSIESMRNEWEVHNILHDLNYKLDHTSDVDLNNADESKYSSKVLTKILWN